MPTASHIAHTGLPFANPMSEAAVDAAIAALPLPADPLLVDTGCGAGEMLVRALRLHPGARGLGIDLDPDAIADARRRAADLPARFEVRDASELEGEFDAVINVASSHVHGGFPAALTALRRLAPVALFADGFWQRPPSADFLAALGGATEDELADLAGLRAAIGAAGFEILHESLAGESDWANYEESLAANAERHGGPDSLAYARRIRERRALPGGTDTLGFGLFVLQLAPRAVSVEARDPQVIALLDELTAELAVSGYTADQTFGYSIDQLERSGVHLMGVHVGGQLVGVGGLEIQGKVGELKRFFVAPAQRGTGVADAVIDALVDLALDNGVEVLRLETGDKQGAAIAFYRRHGFAEIPRFGAYVNSETSVCMERRLEPTG